MEKPAMPDAWMTWSEFEQRMHAVEIRKADLTRELNLATGTPSKWKKLGVPRYAVAYVLALEAMDARSRALYRAAVVNQESLGVTLPIART
jgi:hypothetical protein